MRRNMSLVQQILRQLEARDVEDGRVEVRVEGFRHIEVYEHLLILQDAGFIEGVSRSSGRPSCQRLTWQGHDYLAGMEEAAPAAAPSRFARSEPESGEPSPQRPRRDTTPPAGFDWRPN